MKLSLILNVIDPKIGGVMILGDRGTGKTTTIRAVTDLLPQLECVADDSYNSSPTEEELMSLEVRRRKLAGEALPTYFKTVPMIDLPLGATEDRVLGSLDFSRTIANIGNSASNDVPAKPILAPGLLAAANRGILYIDEVNLLPPHLVDVLLDAAAMGVNTIQREGITKKHPAEFLLIGTMNPEEGDLRPQLVDRFGLCANVNAPFDPKIRAEVVRQRMAFERDPKSFQARWSDAQLKLAEQIKTAQELLEQTTLEDSLLELISQICIEFQVASLRADITLCKTAAALAAWQGMTVVNKEHIRQAAPWVLAHRSQKPFGQDQQHQQQQKQQENDRDQRLHQIMNDSSPEDERKENEENSQEEGEESQGQDQQAENGDQDPNNTNEQLHTFTASKPQQIKKLKINKPQHGQAGSGRRNKLTNAPKNGTYVRARSTDQPVDIALDATLRAAAVNGVHPVTKQPIIRPENWRTKVRHATTDTVILFVVDASGSMAARKRMEAVKGAVLALLTDAYQQRDRVGVISFRGVQAEMLLEPTRSTELASKSLQRLPTGGRTPLAHALWLAHETVQRLQRKEPDQEVLLLVLSDGKANVPLPGGTNPNANPLGDAWTQTKEAAIRLAGLKKISGLILDTEAGQVRIGRAKELADLLGAGYMLLDDLTADGLVHTVRQVSG